MTVCALVHHSCAVIASCEGDVVDGEIYGCQGVLRKSFDEA
jgi:hypothetical protein